METLRLPKSEIVVLARWLNQLPLDGKRSRARTRFVQQLADEMRQIELERKEIVGRYVEVDPNGKWLTETENGQEVWHVSPAKRDDFHHELGELYAEQWVMNVTPENKERLAIIKDIVLNTDYIFGAQPNDTPEEQTRKIQEANSYELWCSAFEQLSTV